MALCWAKDDVGTGKILGVRGYHGSLSTFRSSLLYGYMMWLHQRCSGTLIVSCHHHVLSTRLQRMFQLFVISHAANSDEVIESKEMSSRGPLSSTHVL